MHKIILSLICSFLVTTAFSQETQKFSKIKIDLVGHDIHELAELGLECDHGERAPHKHLINVYSEEELDILSDAGYKWKVLIEDVEAFYKVHGTDDHHYVEVESRSQDCSGATGDLYNYETPENYEYGTMGGYLTYDEALIELDKMSALYPNLITERLPIGDILTHEGRNLYYLVISDNANNIDDTEPQVYYNSLHHAREPNSLSQMIFYMWYLLENYETNPEVKYLVDNASMFFQPIVNPDGYVWNETTNPNGGGFWRKNRFANASGEKVGVDLNRNYGFFWGFDNQGSSPNENAQTYRGPAAFSEPETQATRKLCIDNNFQISLNYHTFGNLLIHPWGYSDEPTDEDILFKSLGRGMNFENDFFVGTGTETVGYTVNGDSDDYMYGEQDEKNKIYSLTPEVGPSFWPNEDQIDILNKSAMRMNLNAAHLLFNYGFAEELLAETFLTADEGTLIFRFEKSGLQAGLIDFSVISETPGLSLSNNSYPALNMNAGETQEFTINYEIDGSFTGEDIDLVMIIDNGVYADRTTINKKYIQQTSMPTIAYSDPISSFDNFVSNDSWGITDDYVSAPFAITDSPNGNYSNNTNSEILFLQNFDLSNAQSANLKFYTKFDIENDYDYTQLQVSRDGINFSPVCGKLTNPAVADQGILGEPVYDANLSDWTLETVCLDDYIGEEALVLKFIFHSDGFQTGDGFYFDELSLEIEDETVSITEIPLNVMSVMPNPANDYVQLTMDAKYFVGDMNYELYDMVGKKLGTNNITNPHQKIDISHLSPGTYIIKLNVGNTLFSTSKVIKN